MNEQPDRLLSGTDGVARLTALIQALDDEEQVRLTPMGRLGQPGEVADVAVWLTSPESSFVTGQTIDVAGGLYMT